MHVMHIWPGLPFFDNLRPADIPLDPSPLAPPSTASSPSIVFSRTLTVNTDTILYLFSGAGPPTVMPGHGAASRMPRARNLQRGFAYVATTMAATGVGVTAVTCHPADIKRCHS